ncbi:hypothetical protein FB558_5085 [Pseudonocardia kunmingensis]|uniref:Uncharacterized protein n=2 Tax=Pseudonocardia kunmingensis TaxID=630975 RepID=A0A543DJ37_9PSEU|nr:hypothetical protein FB558_5085 [Pseudonocardia kunmingensis]
MARYEHDRLILAGLFTARLAAVPALEPRAAALMDELSGQSLRPVQHRVLRRVQQRLAAAGPSPRT